MSINLPVLTIENALAALVAGDVTAEALILQSLTAISEHFSLNAIAELGSEQAHKTARERDRQQATGVSLGPLHGIPITVKDLFEVEGFSTRGGTRAQLGALGTSTAISRLQKAGAIVIGKTNMHEIALGLTGENEWTGDVKNPNDADRQSGGSSSGSAVAVAIGAGFASLGTDTGGSIRVPAALCGVTGFKPTHGLVPLDGALPLSPTCDHAGPLTRNVADARLLTEVLSGQTLPFLELHRPRFAVPRVYLEGRLTTEMREAFERMLVQLKTAGAVLTSVLVSDLELTHLAYTPIVRAEAAHVHRSALDASPERFSAPIREALEAGAALLASEYLTARVLRSRVIQGLRRAFEPARFNALILPTTPSTALRRGETIVNLETGPVQYRDAQLALTAPFSMAGVPVAAIPFGNINGLAVGVQIVTPWAEDALALNLAAWVECCLRMQDRADDGR